MWRSDVHCRRGLQAFQTFMPKVPGHAKNHSKTPIGYQNRLHFPAIPTIAAKTVVHRPSSND
jgi:hypothetical protein